MPEEKGRKQRAAEEEAGPARELDNMANERAVKRWPHRDPAVSDPIGTVQHNGADDDPRLNGYAQVLRFTQARDQLSEKRKDHPKQVCRGNGLHGEKADVDDRFFGCRISAEYRSTRCCSAFQRLAL